MTSRVRELRIARGWTQADLADQLGVSRQTTNAIETERYEPSLSLAFRIAQLFDLTIEQVFRPDCHEAAARRSTARADKSDL